MKKHLILILLLSAVRLCLKAQDHEVALGVRTGHNVTFGTFAAISAETTQRLHDNFMVTGGIQYNTIGKTSLEATPSYIKDYSWGRLSAEIQLAYTNILSINNFTIGAGVGLTGRWISGKLGYYYRNYGRKTAMISEPFNIYYQLCGNLLPMVDDWDLNVIITNDEMFELDRHYQPSFIAQCQYYPLQNLGISLGIGCKPTGIFHISADYYQSFLKLGLCYRW